MEVSLHILINNPFSQDKQIWNALHNGLCFVKSVLSTFFSWFFMGPVLEPIFNKLIVGTSIQIKNMEINYIVLSAIPFKKKARNSNRNLNTNIEIFIFFYRYLKLGDLFTWILSMATFYTFTINEIQKNG